jgi:hypothetical protein
VSGKMRRVVACPATLSAKQGTVLSSLSLNGGDTAPGVA